MAQSSVFWIHADSEARFTQDYTNLAKLASLPPDLKGEDLLIAVKQWIERQDNWILILDNADDLILFKTPHSATSGLQLPTPELLRFVPKTQSEIILWTSRDGSILSRIVGPQGGVEVHAMSDQEAWDLFSNSCGRSETRPPSKDERELLTLLDRLPLAITQAGAYLRKTKVSVPLYLKMLSESEHRQSNLFSSELEDTHRQGVPNSVMHTWLVSMDQIARESRCSETILKSIAFFDNKGIPFELVKATVGPEFSENDILLATGRLLEYSFLQVQRETDGNLPTYDQHRLVSLATRKALTETQNRSFSGKALHAINLLFPAGTHDTWEGCNLYLPHALKVVMRRDTQRYKRRAPALLSRMGRYYWEQGRSDEAERLQVEVLELYKEVVGAKHPDTISAMANLALTWWQQGRSNEAEQLQVEVLELCKEVVGAEHPDTVRAMANLALTWWQQGRSDEAERLQVEVLELCKEVVGTKHPDTITAMANLALTWCQQGRSDEAERLQVEVLELYKEVVGAKHPDTILAIANLALTWRQQGRSNEAERLQVEVLELYKEVVGVKHPDTILAMANLASTWWQQGRSNEAERLQVEVLELREEVVGTEHAVTDPGKSNPVAIVHQLSYNTANIKRPNIPITPPNKPESTHQQTTHSRPHTRLEPVPMDDGYTAGHLSHSGPLPNAYKSKPVVDDNHLPLAPVHCQRVVKLVTLTRIPHVSRNDEFQFTDRNRYTRTTLRSDWTKGNYDGHFGYWYKGSNTDYFTRYKF